MIDNQSLFMHGLCSWGYNLVKANLLSWDEYDNLLVYIKSNRPHKFSSLDAFKRKRQDFFWEHDNIIPRIKWLKKHIIKTKRKNI